MALTTKLLTPKVSGFSLWTVITICPRLFSASAQLTMLVIGTPSLRDDLRDAVLITDGHRDDAERVDRRAARVVNV